MNQKRLRVLFVLSGELRKASSRVRGYWIAEELARLGVKCSTVVADHWAGLARVLAQIPRNDAVVFQKTYSRWHLKLMKIASTLGKVVVFDLDDAPSRVNKPSTVETAQTMMAASTAVTVGGAALQEYARRYQPNTHLIPSSIRLENYPLVEQQSDERQLCVGWVGNGSHYLADLIEILAPVLEMAAENHKIRFKLVGACGRPELHRVFGALPGVEAELIDQIDWGAPTGVASAIADFDIGVYPLLDNEFNRFKCGFKALEYMAMRIPVVASPVGTSSSVIEHGVDGFLANDPRDWADELTLLMGNKALRKEMGRAGRAKIEREYSSEVAARLFLDVLREKPPGGTPR